MKIESFNTITIKYIYALHPENGYQFMSHFNAHHILYKNCNEIFFCVPILER